MRLAKTLSVLSLLLTSYGALAESALDSFRNQDLNDYALGLAFTVAQNPYIGASPTTVIYPILATVEHSSFTRSRLLIRGENIGVRFVTDNDWEFGLVGRVQTLGTGAGDNADLQGVRDRGWAIESGPLLGWRGSPVHLQIRSYWELPNRHSGATTELEFSYPQHLDRGFIVPAVRISYLSDAYNGYYFGVTEQESTASRPVYQPGSATNIWAGVSFGYELTPDWLLRGSIGLEQLDDSIQDSPLVGRDRLWSASIAIAHKANLFVPRDAGSGQKEREFEIRLSTLNGAIDTRVTRDSDDGQPGDAVDLENFLASADRKTVTQFDGIVRISYYHRIELGAFRLTRQASTAIQDDLSFGDQNYPAGTQIQSEVKTGLIRLAYAYSLLRDGQKELGVSAGLSYFSFETSISEAGSPEIERLSASAPLPTFGAFATALIKGKWQLSADARVFALDFDRYDGFMSYASVGLERKFGDIVGVGVGYDFYSLNLSVNKLGDTGAFDFVYQGPKLFVNLAF